MAVTDSRTVTYEAKASYRPKFQTRTIIKTKVFRGTIGPEYRNPDGSIMNRDQLRAHLKMLAEQWEKETCAARE